jgi:hypothetical protein
VLSAQVDTTTTTTAPDGLTPFKDLFPDPDQFVAKAYWWLWGWVSAHPVESTLAVLGALVWLTYRRLRRELMA